MRGHKQESASPRFFDIDFQKYLELNAVDMNEVSDPQLKAEMYNLLEKHGYGASRYTAARPPHQNWLKRARSFIGRLKTPPASPGLEFAELDDAIEYVRNSSQSTPQSPSAVRELLHARELPLQ